MTRQEVQDALWSQSFMYVDLDLEVSIEEQAEADEVLAEWQDADARARFVTSKVVEVL